MQNKHMLQSRTRPSPNAAHAQEELREGLESSRKLVRQSSFLIALSESDGASPPKDNGRELAK